MATPPLPSPPPAQLERTRRAVGCGGGCTVPRKLGFMGGLLLAALAGRYRTVGRLAISVQDVVPHSLKNSPTAAALAKQTAHRQRQQPRPPPLEGLVVPDDRVPGGPVLERPEPMDEAAARGAAGPSEDLWRNHTKTKRYHQDRSSLLRRHQATAGAEGNDAPAKQTDPLKPLRWLPRLDRLAAIDRAPIEGDPLRAETWEFRSRGKMALEPRVPYLGTLIDAGRHYFPLDWLRRVVDRLADMNYNLIHLRLTDDQTFNVLLKSRPQLACPTALENPGHHVYRPAELRELTAYARARGIRIMPEINVPGHAGAWAGIPDLIVHCPGFICERGYGIPLNVTHHELKPILTDVLREIIDIFDNPPFIHLGGDEVNMAGPCFEEVGRKVFDYPAFELILKDIIKDIGYPEDQVVRWEMTGQRDLVRAGGVEHFWESHPGDRHDAKGDFFVSTWLYFDTNADQNAFEVFTKTIRNFHLNGNKTPTAIVAGTFELHPEFWYDRNILGRLLAVAIGAGSPSIDGDYARMEMVVLEQWNELCLFLGFGDIICDTSGQPVIATSHYQKKWREGWDVWKRDICERMTSNVAPRAEDFGYDRNR